MADHVEHSEVPLLKLVEDSDGQAPAAGPLRQPPLVPARTRAARSNARRTAAKARRTWLSLLFFPVFGVYMLLDAIRLLQERYFAKQGHEGDTESPFHRPRHMPDGDARSVRDIVEAIEAFPYEPKQISTQVAFFRDNGPNAIQSLWSADPQSTKRARPYPMTFRQRLFTGDGGEQIAGMQGMHDQPGPALIICHGMLMTKNFDMILQLARRAYEQWGFHVVTIDLRGWGQTSWTTEAPSSLGYYEGLDVIEIARELKRSGLVTTVGAIGFSLGASTVLNATRFSSLADDTPLDGGTIAISAPTDMGEALTYVSQTPHWRDPLFGLSQMFRATIRATVRKRNLPKDVKTWRGLAEEISLPWYELSMEQFTRQASARLFADDIQLPVLDIHARDDFLITVDHAERFAEATADNPNVQVLLRDQGAHCAFEAIDERWFNSTVRRWFEYWATPGDAKR
jgi:predicted alpha/beta-fold hydrolase